MIKHSRIMQMSVPASLGVTCKDALMIFSQNETLQLQKRIQELEKRLKQYEPVNKPAMVYDTKLDWFEANEDIQKIIHNWSNECLASCDITYMYASTNKLSEVCQVSTFIQAVSEAFGIFIKDKKVAHNLAKAGVKFINIVITSVHHADRRQQGSIQAWCENESALKDTIQDATIDYIFDTLVDRKIVEFPRDSDDSDYEAEWEE